MLSPPGSALKSKRKRPKKKKPAFVREKYASVGLAGEQPKTIGTSDMVIDPVPVGVQFAERCSGARWIGSSEELDSVEQSLSVELLISVGVLKPYTGPTDSDDELDEDGDYDGHDESSFGDEQEGLPEKLDSVRVEEMAVDKGGGYHDGA